MRWLYKDRQMNSKAYGESIFSLNELKQIIGSHGFYFHRSQWWCCCASRVRLLWGSLQEVLESKPSLLSACWICVCSQPHLKFFPACWQAGSWGMQGARQLSRGLECRSRVCPHLGGQQVPGGPAVSDPTLYSCYLWVGVEEMLH